ncbi:hypothetical protein IQ247_07285 [Plectonema cf. radiosum LEGE 06105]|uniref:Uncharacterized protein n=1 Tax=Plectonema cf. radiosum LEGE 06105 TaxID=945769 RepID=A0A8J7K1Z9_9CYAN|nr:hypothetical protein [Plectonema radiosum]MBE9212517.1 hypothetical protein [Plectonema cf. radiosum LEGE 06105]
MFNKRVKKKLYRPKGKNLITSNKIEPEFWSVSSKEVKVVLKAAGCKVKAIKKIRLLKYQVCISYWNHEGGVCSGFFSYRLFPTWQKEVELLIEDCSDFKSWQLLNHLMKREFIYFYYQTEMEDALHNALQNRLCVLKAMARQAVSNDLAMAIEWEYFHV